MNRTSNGSVTWESRLLGLLASLMFSVPTAIILWFMVNQELFVWGGFLGSGYLLGCIAVFAVLALMFPRLFPSIMGTLWQLMLKLAPWSGY